MRCNVIVGLLLVVAMSMAGCGGGGGSGSSVPSSTTTTPVAATTVILAGKVADGYIQGATVCLDMNNNKVCDAGEPTATTDASGAYTLNVPAADAAAYPVIAVVPVGAIDSDNPGTPIAKEYTLSTPVGKHAFISPLTVA